MSEKLPRYTAKEILKKLKKIDYIQELWQTWSHKRFVNIKTGEKFTLPYHTSNYIHPKILKDIIKKVWMSINDFKNI